MILQALNSYYERLAGDPDSGVAPEGFAEQPVGFCLELSEDGVLINVYDLRVPALREKLVPDRKILPSRGKSRTVGIEPNFLWDNATYVLGRDDKGKPERTKDCQTAFYELHRNLLGCVEVKEARALLKFLENPEAGHPEIENNWAYLSTANLVFRLQGQDKFLHEYDVLGKYWPTDKKEDDSVQGICLVSGEKELIAQLHPAIKGVSGAQATGAALCSYNLSAFRSFGKEQNLNGPIGRKAAFAYSTSLNYLLRRPNQCVRLGETTVLAWAERPSVLEEAALGFYDEPEPGDKAADPAAAERRMNILRKLAQGLPVCDAWPELEPDVEMHILGLAPNAARLSISFYLTGSAGKFLEEVRAWYADLAIVKSLDWEKDFPSLYEIAKAALGEHKAPKDIKRMADDLLKAALAGGRYPAYLLSLCLNRLRSGDTFSAVHAALIKAMLIRNFKRDKEDLMSLNKEHPSPAYQLGRLFALLVRVQQKAIGSNINADIRDKYFGSASATPALVFPLLIRNAQNHIAKAKAYGYDQLIGEVLGKIDDSFPQTLSLEEQGLFALGYYHQQADKKVEEADKNAESQGVEK